MEKWFVLEGGQQGPIFLKKKWAYKLFLTLVKFKDMENSKDIQHNSVWTFKYESC